MLKSNRKRKVQRKKRLSYDKHHVDCARKASKDAASQDASAKAKKFGVLNDSTNYQKVVMKCRADTPSKIQPRQARRITKYVAEHVNAVTSAILPGMNPSQRERVLAKSYNFNAKIEHANTSSTCSEKEDAEDPSLLVTALRAFRPHLQGKKPIDRRQHIAGFTSMTRKDAERALDINISRWEWSQAKMHARYPGPLKPVERIKHRRIRIPQKTLLEIFDFIGDNMQGHAYGMNACKLENGELIQLDAVSTTASNSKLCRDWAQVAEMITLCESEIPAENNRCKQKCPKTKKRCLLVKNHEKKHKFTPADSVCASMLERIINKLGNGAIKSLAGLDDEDTLKGGGNFKRLYEIHEILANIHCVTPHEKKETEKQITEALLFHKTNFKKHLSKGNKICQCICCGFSVPDPTPSPFSDDPTISPTANNTDASNGKKTKATKGSGKAAAKKNASNGKKTAAKKGSGKAAAEKNASNWTECMPCKNRDENSHEGPCSDCEKSFGIFDSLLKMATSAQNLPNISARQMENFSELEFEIKKRRKYHNDWRSHIIRKKTESDYDRKQLQTMAKNEVILISDFKMKIFSVICSARVKKNFMQREEQHAWDL